MPRSTIPPEERTTAVRLKTKTVELVNRHLKKALDAQTTPVDGELTDVVLANQRREFLTYLIERELGPDAKPIQISVNAAYRLPDGEQSAEMAQWLKEQEQRLYDEAPEFLKVRIDLVEAVKSGDMNAVRTTIERVTARAKEESDDRWWMLALGFALGSD